MTLPLSRIACPDVPGLLSPGVTPGPAPESTVGVALSYRTTRPGNALLQAPPSTSQRSRSERSTTPPSRRFSACRPITNPSISSPSAVREDDGTDLRRRARSMSVRAREPTGVGEAPVGSASHVQSKSPAAKMSARLSILALRSRSSARGITMRSMVLPKKLVGSSVSNSTRNSNRSGSMAA